MLETIQKERQTLYKSRRHRAGGIGDNTERKNRNYTILERGRIGDNRECRCSCHTNQEGAMGGGLTMIQQEKTDAILTKWVQRTIERAS